MQTAILITGLLSLGALLGWMFWAASRILNEDRIAQAAKHVEWVRETRMPAGQRSLRFKDIREREAERMATIPEEVDYLYDEGYSVGWPEEWTDDVMLRRN